MALSPDILRGHLAYTTWASLRLLHVAASLPEEQLTRDFQTADRSVLGTLVHIFAADRVWLTRVTQAPAIPFVTDTDYSLSILQREWPEVLRKWSEWAASLTTETAAESISYKDMKGNPWSTPAWQIVLHLVNHGTHHRGQVSGFLRAMGHVPPPLDLIAYYRELAAAHA